MTDLDKLRAAYERADPEATGTRNPLCRPAYQYVVALQAENERLEALLAEVRQNEQLQDSDWSLCRVPALTTDLPTVRAAILGVLPHRAGCYPPGTTNPGYGSIRCVCEREKLADAILAKLSDPALGDSTKEAKP